MSTATRVSAIDYAVAAVRHRPTARMEKPSEQLPPKLCAVEPRQ